MRPKGTSAELERRPRRIGVALLEEGMMSARVAEVLETSRASVTRWRQAYEESGEAALAAKPHPGRPPKLAPGKRRRLAKLLVRGARKYGYSTDLWTLRRVSAVIALVFGVEYHPSQVWRILRAMGWSSQKPERRARERDEQEIARWRREEWPRLKKRPKKRAKHRVPG